MKKVLSLIIVVLAAAIMAACSLTVDVSTTATVKSTDGVVAIKVEEATENAKLIHVMGKLKAAGELDYTISGGFVGEINGKAGAADYSSFWALYTSDAEYSNAEWGTFDYDGITLASASLGANDLKVKAGEYYVWVFTEFSY